MKDAAVISENRVVPKPLVVVFVAMAAAGVAGFWIRASGDRPETAWMIYLVNFMVFSGIAQGGLLFSVVMNTTRARWTGVLAGISESFSAFFPVSLVLFLALYPAREFVFPWMGQDLHGKEVWLNVPFLFTRNLIGLMILYGLGLAYIRCDLAVRNRNLSLSRLERSRKRKTIAGNLYILAFALVVSLNGFDLVMSMDPHWYSTLFGAYTFVKAFYAGLAAVIILAALLRLHPGFSGGVRSSQFHDIGKLLFAFCMVWGDFLYVQLVVIWYGNIPEESAYVIRRIMTEPWETVAWMVLLAGFFVPFLILINRRIKTVPVAMGTLCVLVLSAIWLEHVLLLGPIFHPLTDGLPLVPSDGLICLGFLGLMALSVTWFLNRFPQLVLPTKPEAQ
jgi:hypothetical protein